MHFKNSNGYGERIWEQMGQNSVKILSVKSRNILSGENPSNRFNHTSLLSKALRSQHLYLNTPTTMEFPSEEWEYLDNDDFDTAPVDLVGEHTLSLYAQLRPTGRILDHFRAALGGASPLVTSCPLDSMIPAPCFKGWTFKTQVFPRDINIRKNMLSTAWIDTPAQLLFNDASVYNSTGEVVANDTFMALLDDLPESGPDTVATRYCVVIGADRRPALQHQSLPASATFLSGKTAFKG